MPIEQGVMRRKKFGKVEQSILGVIGMAGMLAIGAVAPNALLLLGYAMKRMDAKRKQTIDNAFRRLLEGGYIQYQQLRGEKVVRLTLRGKVLLHKSKTLQRVGHLKQWFTWDGKWRIVAFDIREYKRNIRDQIRNELISFGLVRFQQSMWIYPYDCSDLVTLLKADYHIGRELAYICADTIADDRWLRKIFHLPIDKET